MDFEILPADLLKDYLLIIPAGLQKAFDELHDAELSTQNFSFYTSVASVFSSKIEGENIELDSYIKHKRDGFTFQADYTKKVDDLYQAYEFARVNLLNEKNLIEAHKLLSKHFVAKPWQGKYRHQSMYVATDDGRIEYVAAAPQSVVGEMNKFFADVAKLKELQLTIEEVFYFSALLHLVFVKIHPWIDGNGRSARLIEKWFLAEKLGQNAWYIPSERMYYQNHNLYYQHIRALGLEYDFLDYSKALPFLGLLPGTLFSK